VGVRGELWVRSVDGFSVSLCLALSHQYLYGSDWFERMSSWQGSLHQSGCACVNAFSDRGLRWTPLRSVQVPPGRNGV
jgi:hypothetical protein